MPLAFNSISHGIIPFGFFNIETDLLLLDKYAFFATDFCNLIKKIVSYEKADECFEFNIFQFDVKADLGDLHSAISGIKFVGFIGSVYKCFPFPKDLLLFKQARHGYKTKEIILSLIEQYAQSNQVVVRLNSELIQIGVYRFNLYVFNQILQYVISGGYPRWEDEIPPDYVACMKQEILKNNRFKS